ncbi:MAG: bifunctional oligoribonuclease/PAP phosphatase NrnA [Lachnospiraceae bacterium]|nr:bifunctional oligoribonuclease/PAP phosphatase NrnA [Lachnospiraceae bacterium]
MSNNLFRKANAAAAQYIEEAILSADSIGIVGHIRPDGDDVGACLGMKGYIGIIKPSAKVTVYLQDFSKDFAFLRGAGEVVHDFSAETRHDLCFMLDCADMERMGEAGKYYEKAGKRICIDHHATNDGVFDSYEIINPERSSSCEVICTLIDMDRLDRETAECLYLGIVHDTGVFKHSNTSMETMIYAGKLIDLGASPSKIIDNTFYKKTFEQIRALGTALTKAKRLLDGKLIYSFFTNEMMKQANVSSMDLDGVIDQLRVTEGTEVALFIYEMPAGGSFKVSLRSNGPVDVSIIAKEFGGGGHVKAAGCEINGTPEDIALILAEKVKEQL